MADSKLTALTALTTPSDDDLLYIVDDPGGTPIERKITKANLLSGLAPLASPAFSGTPTGITKAHVGLENVDNTTDAGKPVSAATQTALDAKAPLASPVFTGTPTGITKTHVGLGNVDDTTDLGKPISTATQTALDGKRNNYTLVATLASDAATGADTTPITLTGLVFTYAINAVYRIWFMGRVSPAAATTGCGFQLDLSSAVTDVNVNFFHQLANTGTLTGGHSIADDASVGVSSGTPGTSTYPVMGSGILRTAGNTGTAQLRFKSETTAVITAKAGLTMIVEKVA